MSNPYLSDLSDTFSDFKYSHKGPKLNSSKNLKNSNEFYLHYDPIDPDMEVVFANFCSGIFFPYSDVLIPSSFDINCRSALKKLFLALDGYLISTGFKPFIPIDELIHICISVKGQKRLKKYRKDALLSTFNLQYFSEAPRPLKVGCIGDIFNYRFAILYRDETIEDYKLGLLDVNISKNDLDLFKEAISEFVPNDFVINEDEIELAIKMAIPCSSSMCIADSLDYKSVCTGIYTQSIEDKPSLDGKRLLIPIHCENVRDAVMFTPITTAYIKVLDDLIVSMFSHNKWFTMGLDKEGLLRRVRDFRKKHNFFVCFDFEKEGITKPRELIIAILEVLNEKYNSKFLRKCIELYSQYTLFVDGEELSMKRGHGLGMANSLTSVVILGLLSVILGEIQEDSYKTIEGLDFDVLSFNDDTTISINEEDFISFEEHFSLICERYSVRYKREKTFYGKEFVFCEEYSDSDFNNKISYYYSTIFTASMCVNVTHAKQFIGSLTIVEPLKEIFYEFLNQFGYEFFEEEISSPLAFGGWFGKSIFKVDLSFYEKDFFLHEELAACRAISKASIRRKKANHHPFLEYNDEPFMFSMPSIERLRGKKYNDYWRRLYKRRQQLYKRYLDKDLSIIEVYEKYRKGKIGDVLPWKKYNNYEPYDKTTIINYDLWRSDKPLSDYLIYDKPIAFMIGSLGRYKQLNAFQRRERMLYLQSTSNILTFKDNDRFNENRSSRNLEMSYWRPERVIAALAVIHPLENFKIPFKINSEIKEVKNRYGYSLTDQFFEFMSKETVTMDQESLRKISNMADRFSLSGEDLYNALLEFYVQVTLDLKEPEEKDTEIDFNETILNIIDLELKDLPNADSVSHKKLRSFIHQMYEGWVTYKLEGEFFVPRLNLNWRRSTYQYWDMLFAVISLEELNLTGWFKTSEFEEGGVKTRFFPEITGSLNFIYSDSDKGGKEQSDKTVDEPIIIPEIIVVDDFNQENSSEDLNAMDAFDLLENMDW